MLHDATIKIAIMNKIKVASLIERIGNLLRAEERACGADLGLQSVHIQILGYLSQCNRYSDTPAAVTEYLGSTKGTTSQSINILEQKGFIIKRSDKADGRVVHLDLTDKGEQFVRNKFPSEQVKAALDSMDSKDSKQLTNLLTKFLIQLQKKNEGKLFGVCSTCRHFKRYGLGDTHQCGLTMEPLSEEESFQICREHESPTKIAV